MSVQKVEATSDTANDMNWRVEEWVEGPGTYYIVPSDELDIPYCEDCAERADRHPVIYHGGDTCEGGPWTVEFTLFDLPARKEDKE